MNKKKWPMKTCGECRFVRRRMLVLRQNKNSMDESERLQRQQTSSKVRLSVLSPESQKARQDNVRRERKNFRRVAERMIKRTSFTVNEQQNSELVKLIEYLESFFFPKKGKKGSRKYLKRPKTKSSEPEKYSAKCCRWKKKISLKTRGRTVS